jgi:hypothetical protein
MGRIIRRLKQLRLTPFDRGAHAAGGERGVENTDALAAAAGGPGRMDPQGQGGHSGAPPNYVKTDDGRPRH